LSKIHQDNQNALFSVANERSVGGNNPSHDFSAQDQSQIMAIRDRQDNQLDDLHQHMVRVHEMSASINTEIGEHIDLLHDVDEQVEYTSGRMGSALRKIDKLLTAAGDKGALFIVIFLILVLIGLVILVF
jgi:hypothetical protein